MLAPNAVDRANHVLVSPHFGAVPDGDATAFGVWAPTASSVEVILERADTGPRVFPLDRAGNGTFEGRITAARAGDLYRYRLDGGRTYPDPASRFQPFGVHGPSEIVDPRRFIWSDAKWAGLEPRELVIYEVHVGTSSGTGTFAGLAERLPDIAALGVTAVELMPVAAFTGTRNWGYDGVALFAPAAGYGRPDDLRRLVDMAHAVGLGVLLDVVYNHVGPDGAYLAAYSPSFFSEHHTSPWGAAINLDGDQSEMVRQLLIDNALHWIREYHIDGLRLDATHALVDEGPRHFLAELSGAVHAFEPALASIPETPAIANTRRRPILIAEDSRNLVRLLRPETEAGWGLDGAWADDFHHLMRRLLAGDREGYFCDYDDDIAAIAETLRRGWYFCGQYSRYRCAFHGTPPEGVPLNRFILCLQNHDQIGNRPFGERLHHQIDLAAYRAATTVLLCAPETPLLFMGQEWAASTPFLYFTDHHEELGRQIAEGRRAEFRAFSGSSEAAARARLPHPQAIETFIASRLRWDERGHEPHASTLRFYRALLDMRRRYLTAPTGIAQFDARALDSSTLLLRHDSPNQRMLMLVRLRGAGRVEVTLDDVEQAPQRLSWHPLLTTEDAAFAADAVPIPVRREGRICQIHFARPGAVILTTAAETTRLD